jgi:hypothetical protein
MTSNLKTLVQAILMNSAAYEWSLQGFGMLRLHLPNNYRLHVWDSRFRVPNVSMVHDHMQWGLHSTVVAGRLVNLRYRENLEGREYLHTTLKPGYGCYFKHPPKPTRLTPLTPHFRSEGQSYDQRAQEIHETEAQDGTVTLMQKFPTGDESARVFWPAHTQWVSAEPRRATTEEVVEITGFALKKWFT